MDLQAQQGLLTTYRENWRNRGLIGWLISLVLISFYLLIYFGNDVGLQGTAWDMDAWARALGLRSRWFIYAVLYSLAMIGGAIYYLRRHGNSRYNQIRIAVNVGVQIILATAIPFVMPIFFVDEPNLFSPDEPWAYWQYEPSFSYLWPLDWYDLHPSILKEIPLAFAIYSLIGAFVAVPLLAYHYGKRWYCSWICGCGALANTFGDPYRHLTSKSTAAWRFEKQALYTVMFLAIASTVLLLLDGVVAEEHEIFHRIVAGDDFWSIKSVYAFVVTSILAGVIGTGVYPILGPRIWCRNFCPMAAVLGLFQKLGRFRIRVKPDMCISCGNCSTYCEMGIDVRAYAQSNKSFTRAACVGCGMCAHVCPRGVLRLENVPRLSEEKLRQKLPVVDL